MKNYRSRHLAWMAKAAMLLALAGIASSVVAQALPRLWARHRGTGTYEIRGSADTWKLGEAAIYMEPDNSLRIDVRGPNLNLELSGRATGWATRHQISIVLDRFDGKPTNVKGWVRVDDRGGFERFELDGQEPARIGISFLSNGANLAGAAPAPPVVVPPASTVRLTEEHGTDRRGSDFTNFRARDLAECTSACRNDSRCQAYSFSRPDSMCYLKSAAPGANSSRDHVSGVKVTTSGDGIGGGGSAAFDVRDGFDQPGGDYASFATSQSSDCLARCDQNPRCLAFTYNRASGVCYLKNRISSFQPRRDVVSGARTP
jgi:hypothetical protein